MVVIMGIIAILLALGAAGFFSIRKQFLLDAETEELLSTIREAQNKSISVMDGANANTKVWTVGNFNNATRSYELTSLYEASTGVLAKTTPTASTTEKVKTLPLGFTINVSYSTPITGSGNGLIAYAAPFGKSYITKDYYVSYSTGACVWTTDGTRINKDYFLSTTCPAGTFVTTTQNQSMNITLSYAGNSKTIIVKSNGDSYVQ